MYTLMLFVFPQTCHQLQKESKFHIQIDSEKILYFFIEHFTRIVCLTIQRRLTCGQSLINRLRFEYSLLSYYEEKKDLFHNLCDKRFYTTLTCHVVQIWNFS